MDMDEVLYHPFLNEEKKWLLDLVSSFENIHPWLRQSEWQKLSKDMLFEAARGWAYNILLVMGKIIENYELKEQLGEGVYAKVYKAVHLVSKQEVAIKVVQA